MNDVTIAAVSAGLFILFVAFVASRLLRARNAGLSIRMQIFLAIASIVGAFALALGIIVVDRVKARVTLLAQESARAEGVSLAALVRSEIELKGRALDEVSRDFERARAEGGAPLQVSILDSRGRPLVASDDDQEQPGFVRVTVPIIVREKEIGAVRVTKPTVVIQKILADFAPAILVLSVVLAVASAVAAAIIGRTIASPIERLTDFAVRVSEGERRAAPPPAQGREVQRLSTALDSMRRELEGRPFVETFAADLSHELKNPVAAIKASAEILVDGALEEPEEAERFVRRILEATGRIEALLGDLLSLARIEARGLEDAGSVGLREVAEEVLARNDSPDPEDRLSGSEVMIRGDKRWLTRLVENLVENGRTHGTGGPVRIEVLREGSNAVLVVTSQGRIGQDVKKRLFRRFITTRADRGGTGLGLAIVRAIAEAHGGNAECAVYGPPEVSFRVVFPIATIL